MGWCMNHTKNPVDCANDTTLVWGPSRTDLVCRNAVASCNKLMGGPEGQGPYCPSYYGSHSDCICGSASNCP
jgi:hypothetical protein